MTDNSWPNLILDHNVDTFLKDGIMYRKKFHFLENDFLLFFLSRFNQGFFPCFNVEKLAIFFPKNYWFEIKLRKEIDILELKLKKSNVALFVNKKKVLNNDFWGEWSHFFNLKKMISTHAQYFFDKMALIR
jgi:hypothetical protein